MDRLDHKKHGLTALEDELVTSAGEAIRFYPVGITARYMISPLLSTGIIGRAASTHTRHY